MLAFHQPKLIYQLPCPPCPVRWPSVLAPLPPWGVARPLASGTVAPPSACPVRWPSPCPGCPPARPPGPGARPGVQASAGIEVFGFGARDQAAQ